MFMEGENRADGTREWGLIPWQWLFLLIGCEVSEECKILKLELANPLAQIFIKVVIHLSFSSCHPIGFPQLINSG